MPMTSIAARTRERLIDVARQLFASNGVERTTMNDIAAASLKGRRTIYTYFRNKMEIYEAVIEREAEQIVGRLREVAASACPPVEKLERYIHARFDILEEAVAPTSGPAGKLLSYLTLDYKRLERIRLLAVGKEKEILGAILAEGISSGDFDPVQAEKLATVHQMVFQGVDYCRIRDGYSDAGVDPDRVRADVAGFITRSLASGSDRKARTQHPTT